MVKPGSEAKSPASIEPCAPETSTLTGGAVKVILEILNGIVPVMAAPLVEEKSTSKLASPWAVVLATTE